MGWDPVYAPDGQCTESEIVNLGYVLNVTLALSFH